MTCKHRSHLSHICQLPVGHTGDHSQELDGRKFLWNSHGIEIEQLSEYEHVAPTTKVVIRDGEVIEVLCGRPLVDRIDCNLPKGHLPPCGVKR